MNRVQSVILFICIVLRSASAHSQDVPNSPILDFIFNPETNIYAILHASNTIDILDATSNNKLHTIDFSGYEQTQAPGFRVSELRFSPSDDMLAVSFWGDMPNGLIVIIDAIEGNIVRDIRVESVVTSFDWSPDGSQIASIFELNPLTSGSSYLNLLNVETGEELDRQRIGVFSPSSIDWHPSNAQVVFPRGKDLIVWDMIDWNEVYETSGDEIGLTSVAWSPDGDIIAGIGNEDILRLWQGDTGTLINEYKADPYKRFIPEVFWQVQKSTLVGVNTGNRVQIWNTQTGQVAFNTVFDQYVPSPILLENDQLIVPNRLSGEINRENLNLVDE